MPKPTIADCLKNGLASYTGRAVASIKVFPDPKVIETYGARAIMAEGDTIDFFIVGSHMPKCIRLSTAEEIADAIEECHFAEWPQNVGNIKFF